MEGIITAILPQERSQGRRCDVFIQHRFAFSLGAEAAAGLRVGQVLDEARVQELLAADEQQRATDVALAFLAYRPRSEQEVRRRLGREYPAGVVEAVLEKLRGWSLVDDEAFARSWVEQRQASRPRGARLLRQELRRQGIDAELATRAAEAGGDEREAALRAARRKARSLKGCDEPEFRRRLGAHLARRGFDWETIEAVAREAWAELKAGP